MIDVVSHDGIRLCDGLSRRRMLQVGGLTPLGLTWPMLCQARGTQPAAEGTSATFGRAKRVIMLFMWGGPAHQDTWDLKPDGPAKLRGEFLPIATRTPGMHISEHFPRIAGQSDKLAIIRSVGQEDNNHSTGAHAGLTGRRHEVKAENFGARDTDFPHYGSVLSKLRPVSGGLPSFVALPDVIATTNGTITPGQFAGMLGRRYDPFHITDHPDEAEFSISTLKFPQGLNNQRMRRRRGLLEQIDGAARLAERSGVAQSLGAFYQQALDMVLSGTARQAFDLSRVSDEERNRYGWHTFGQSTLLARRLIEAGVQLVTVYWHREKKTVDSSWDTHSLNFQELRNRLMPSVDRPIAALLQDLEDRGLLDETLVVWNSEFGRTPKINGNAGRDHWGPCNSVVMAGGGVPGGQVFGASDAAAAYPARDKVTQDDIAATMYHLLGFEPETLVHDRLGRPFPVALGQPIHRLLGNQATPPSIPPPPPLPVRVTPAPFKQMLINRGGRFVCCNFGSDAGENEWKLTGWSPPNQNADISFRETEDDPALLKYTGHYYPHFDFSHIAFRLARPLTAEKLKLTLNGTLIPIKTAHAPATPRTIWQIELPLGMIKASKAFELAIGVKGWPVRDFALLGDPIRDLHLAQLES